MLEVSLTIKNDSGSNQGTDNPQIKKDSVLNTYSLINSAS